MEIRFNAKGGKDRTNRNTVSFLSILENGFKFFSCLRPDFEKLIRLPEINNSPRSRRIWGRLQGAVTRAYQGICAGGGNAVDGRKDKQDGGIIYGSSRISVIFPYDQSHRYFYPLILHKKLKTHI
ncbi:hypothetical protein [Desulfosarcina ovata]|uniref:hypothetical protein n=1 Tax=Desulfosarcina ovata TaxID=83564 RepID=UPI0012D33ACE|nr:hypothetical protein [Desulfosarcina ovata]